MTASIVMHYDDPGSGFRTWIGALCGFAAASYGYGDDGPKFLNLASTCSFLGDAWQRIKDAHSDWMGAIAECMSSEPALVGMAYGCVIAGVGGVIAAFGGPSGVPIVAVGGAIIGLVAAVCILVGDYAFHRTLFLGTVWLTFPMIRRRGRRAAWKRSGSSC